MYHMSHVGEKGGGGVVKGKNNKTNVEPCARGRIVVAGGEAGRGGIKFCNVYKTIDGGVRSPWIW